MASRGKAVWNCGYDAIEPWELERVDAGVYGLIGRVTTVSVRTVAIVEAMREA